MSISYLWASLFDMDGTLVDSTAGVAAAWEAVVKEYPDKDLRIDDILSCGLFFSWHLSADITVVYSISWHQDR